MYAELSAQPRANVAFSNAVQNFKVGSAMSLLCSVGMSKVCHVSASANENLPSDGSAETQRFKAGRPPAMNVAPLARLTARGRAESSFLGASCTFQVWP